MTTSEASEISESEVYPENGGLAGLFDSEEISDKVEEIRNSPLQRLIDINGVEINQNGDITFEGMNIKPGRYLVIQWENQLILFYGDEKNYFSLAVRNDTGVLSKKGRAGYSEIHDYDIINDFRKLEGPMLSGFGGPIRI